MSTIFQHIMQIQAEIQEELLKKQNVVGVATGYKESGGVITDEPAVVVMVQTKHPLTALAAEDVIPKQVGTVRTDVYEVGRLEAQVTPTDRFRPTIPAGVSIGHPLVTAGTHGIIVRDRTTSERLILSNNHVLANCNQAQAGDPMLQPGALDGGQNPADMVARLERFIPLKFLEDAMSPTPSPTPPTQPTPPAPTTEAGGCWAFLFGLAKLFGKTGSGTPLAATAAAAATSSPAPSFRAFAATLPPGTTLPTNLLDCALARPIDTSMFSDQILGIGVVRASRTPQLGMRVRKSGRTTGVTESVVTLINATVDINYTVGGQGRTGRFTGQIICEPMSQGGDSGSLIVDTENYAVGLLFAGSPLATIFTPMETVLDALNIMLGY